jgi:hypothetical protein
MGDHVHLPKVVGTVGLFVVVGGAYYGVPFEMTVGLAAVAAAAAAALVLLARTGLDGPATEARQ